MNMDLILVLIVFNLIGGVHLEGYNFRSARWTTNTYRQQNLLRAGSHGSFSYVCRAHRHFATLPGYSFQPDGCCNIGMSGYQPVCDESVQYLVEDVEYDWVAPGIQDNVVVGGMDDSGRKLFTPCLAFVNHQLLVGFSGLPGSKCYVLALDGVHASTHFSVLQASSPCQLSDIVGYCLCK